MTRILQEKTMDSNHFKIYDEELAAAGIRLTALRSLIWRTLRQRMRNAFALADVEELLYPMDKSTIFRTLTLFSEARLLHLIDDGSGCQKYCICHCHDTRNHHGHVHLSCVKCRRTWCLDDVPIPVVDVSPDFMVRETEYVVKGICAQCRKSMGC